MLLTPYHLALIITDFLLVFTIIVLALLTADTDVDTGGRRKLRDNKCVAVRRHPMVQGHGLHVV